MMMPIDGSNARGDVQRCQDTSPRERPLGTVLVEGARLSSGHSQQRDPAKPVQRCKR